MLKYLHGIPYVFEVRDCWPEAPIQLGYVRNPLYQSVLRYLEKRIYKGAESIIALSVPMQAHVQKIAPKKTVKVIPNFADVEFFGDKAPDDEGLYHVVYAGTFGHANRIHRLLMLALEAHKAHLPVQFTLAGSGAERERAEAFVLQNNLVRSVKFLPHLSTYGVRDLLATADAAYVGFRQEPILESNSPNKFFDALAAGVPVLLGVKGWLADIVHLAECGEVLSDHATDLDGLNALMAKNQVQLQQAAREWAHRFDKNQLAQAVVSAIDHTEPVAAMVKDWVSLQEHS
jgi:glycosyltransferase involved in cell wall biosynthesis